MKNSYSLKGMSLAGRAQGKHIFIKLGFYNELYLGYIRNVGSSRAKANDQNGGLGHFTKGDAGEARKPTKIWQTSLIIREMQIKATTLYHHVSSRRLAGLWDAPLPYILCGSGRREQYRCCGGKAWQELIQLNNHGTQSLYPWVFCSRKMETHVSTRRKNKSLY